MADDADSECLEDEKEWQEYRDALLAAAEVEISEAQLNAFRIQFMRDQRKMRLEKRAADAAERSAAEAAAARSAAHDSGRKTNWGILIALVALIVAAWPYILALFERIAAALR